MSRPFSERLRDSTWWLEQAGHVLIGDVFGIVAGSIVFSQTGIAFAAFFSSVGSGAIAAIAREMQQNIGDDDNDIPDAIADAVFTALGGVLAAIPWAVVEWATP